MTAAEKHQVLNTPYITGEIVFLSETGPKSFLFQDELDHEGGKFNFTMLNSVRDEFGNYLNINILEDEGIELCRIINEIKVSKVILFKDFSIAWHKVKQPITEQRVA